MLDRLNLTRGMKSSEFLLSLSLVVAVWVAAGVGDVNASEAVDFSKWVLTVFVGSRSLTKLGKTVNSGSEDG